jgi:hypothetical protein
VSPGDDGALRGVACPSPRWCVAVGSAGGSADPSTRAGLAEIWDGSTWRLTPVPASGRPSVLEGVACSAPDHCVAVGADTSQAGDSEALIVAWDGRRWSRQPAAAPPGAEGWLEGAACPSAQTCVAVGRASYGNEGDGDGSTTLAETSAGAAWSATPAADPSTASAELSVLSSVACPATSGCIAAGSYDSGNVFRSEPHPLLEIAAGGSWIERPEDAAITSLAGALLAVSCFAADRCVAVGPALILRLHDGVWSHEASAAALAGVACPAPSRCLAVGTAAGAAFARWLSLDPAQSARYLRDSQPSTSATANST